MEKAIWSPRSDRSRLNASRTGRPRRFPTGAPPPGSATRHAAVSLIVATLDTTSRASRPLGAPPDRRAPSRSRHQGPVAFVSSVVSMSPASGDRRCERRRSLSVHRRRRLGGRRVRIGSRCAWPAARPPSPVAHLQRGPHGDRRLGEDEHLAPLPTRTPPATIDRPWDRANRRDGGGRLRASCRIEGARAIPFV